jgi:hypothetical protein
MHGPNLRVFFLILLAALFSGVPLQSPISAEEHPGTEAAPRRGSRPTVIAFAPPVSADHARNRGRSADPGTELAGPRSLPSNPQRSGEVHQPVR